MEIEKQLGEIKVSAELSKDGQIKIGAEFDLMKFLEERAAATANPLDDAFVATIKKLLAVV